MDRGDREIAVTHRPGAGTIRPAPACTGLFSVDGQENLTNPAGLTGRTLDIDCHIIHGIQIPHHQLLPLCAGSSPGHRGRGLRPGAAQFVLNRQVKQAGALLIDMGAGTTDYVLAWTASSWPPDADPWAATTFPMTSR